MIATDAQQVSRKGVLSACHRGWQTIVLRGRAQRYPGVGRR